MFLVTRSLWSSADTLAGHLCSLDHHIATVYQKPALVFPEATKTTCSGQRHTSAASVHEWVAVTLIGKYERDTAFARLAFA